MIEAKIDLFNGPLCLHVKLNKNFHDVVLEGELW